MVRVRDRKEWINTDARGHREDDRKEQGKTHPRIVQTREDGAPGCGGWIGVARGLELLGSGLRVNVSVEILSDKSRNLRSPILVGWVQDDREGGDWNAKVEVE